MRPELNEEFARRIVDEAIKRGAGAAEVSVRQRRDFSVTVRLGEIETLQESADAGFGLRVLTDGRQASVSGSDLEWGAVQSMVAQAVEMVRATSPDDTAGLPDASAFKAELPFLDLYDEHVNELATETKIELALRAEQAARDVSPKIVNFSGGGFDSSVGSLILANSLGFFGTYQGSTCSLSTVPIASDGDTMQRDSWYDLRRKLAELDSPETIGVTAAERTLRKLGGKPVPSQTVPVVFEPEIAAELLSDVFQAVSGDTIFRKSSFLVNRLGDRIASDLLTVIDDGTLPGKLGSRPFDGEGLPTRRTVVIRNGVLESYLLNTYTGRKLGLNSTGNAARGLVGAPTVGAGNLYIQPGKHTHDEIVNSVSKGFLVTELLGFGVNIVNGDYSRSASGIWIENGELTFPVQGVTIAGNLKEILQSIEMVGDQLDFRGNIAAPTLLISRLTIGA